MSGVKQDDGAAQDTAGEGMHEGFRTKVRTRTVRCLFSLVYAGGCCPGPSLPGPSLTLVKPFVYGLDCVLTIGTTAICAL